MKTNFFLIAACLIFLALIVQAQGKQNVSTNQVVRDTLCAAKLKIAAQLLNKRDSLTYNPTKAFVIYQECAEAGSGRAMLQLGFSYRWGRGTDTNYVESKKWFEKAVTANLPSALIQLGIIQEFALGVPQDFGRAYEYFQRASDLNLPEGWERQGYMLLKGLGCKQDYEQSVTLLRKSARGGLCHAMYLFAFCLRNGYGIGRDTAQANLWYHRAIKAGCPHAGKELVDQTPQNPFDKINPKIIGPDENEQVAFQRSNTQPTAKELAGVYDGYLVEYDWSKQHVIKQYSLRIQLAALGTKITGIWVVNDTAKSALEAKLTDTTLLLTRLTLMRNNLASNFVDGDVEILKSNNEIFLAGDVRLYSSKKKEPEHPTYLSLRHAVSTVAQNLKSGQDDNSSATEGTKGSGEISEVFVFPNPVKDIINLSVTLQNTSEIKVVIVDMGGKLVYNSSLGSFSSGKQTIPISFEAIPGIYVVKISAGKDVVSTMVVKK